MGRALPYMAPSMAERARILAIIGTRPEAIKLLPLVRAIRDDGRMECRICLTGQHRELIEPVMKLWGVAADDDLGVLRAGQSLDALAARLLTAIGGSLEREAPQCVLVQGDTTSAMAGAIAAYHRTVPIAHVEAGLRSGDPLHPWPEEGNRRIVSALAQWHFAPTRSAQCALMAENIDPARIWLTGNTGLDALLWCREELARDPQLGAAGQSAIAAVGARRVVLVTVHRRENLPRLGEIVSAIARIARREDVAIVLPLHRQPQLRETLVRGLADIPNVILLDDLDYASFVRIMIRCAIVLTDSGGVQEEGPALGKPVLVMRQRTERGEAVATGNAELVGMHSDAIVAAASRLLDDRAAYDRMARQSFPFGDGRASERIVRVLHDELVPATRSVHSR